MANLKGNKKAAKTAQGESLLSHGLPEIT